MQCCSLEEPGVPSILRSIHLGEQQAAQAFTRSHESCWLFKPIVKKVQHISGSNRHSARRRGCVPLKPRRVWSAG